MDLRLPILIISTFAVPLLLMAVIVLLIALRRNPGWPKGRSDIWAGVTFLVIFTMFSIRILSGSEGMSWLNGIVLAMLLCSTIGFVTHGVRKIRAATTAESESEVESA